MRTLSVAGQEGEGPRKGVELDCGEELDHVAGPTELPPLQIGAVPTLLPERLSSGPGGRKGCRWE